MTNSGKIYPYEINIGLSGDGFADRLFPLISPKLSLYDIETNNIYFNRFLNPKIYRNKYVSYLNNRLIIGKKIIKNIYEKNFFITGGTGSFSRNFIKFILKKKQLKELLFTVEMNLNKCN